MTSDVIHKLNEPHILRSYVFISPMDCNFDVTY